MADSIVGRRQRQVDAWAQKIGHAIKATRELKDLVLLLDQEIEAEERRTGIVDPMHFAYSTYATATRERKRNLCSSIDVLTRQVDHLKGAIAEATIDRNRLGTLGSEEPELLFAERTQAPGLPGYPASL